MVVIEKKAWSVPYLIEAGIPKEMAYEAGTGDYRSAGSAVALDWMTRTDYDDPSVVVRLRRLSSMRSEAESRKAQLLSLSKSNDGTRAAVALLLVLDVDPTVIAGDNADELLYAWEKGAPLDLLQSVVANGMDLEMAAALTGGLKPPTSRRTMAQSMVRRLA